MPIFKCDFNSNDSCLKYQKYGLPSLHIGSGGNPKRNGY